MKQVKAIIADDEEVLRTHLRKRLEALWSGLIIAGEARDGETALRLIGEVRPDVAFLDIRMPGLSGIEVARKAAGRCRIVFVTAYDKYAVQAFENEAVDYLLKPVTDDRLGRTIRRLQEMLAVASPVPDLSAAFEKVSRALRAPSGFLNWIKVQHKDAVRLIPATDVCYFRATDKYTTVRTPEGEFLIRKTIRELEEELDPEMFWRVHRAAIVNVKSIHAVSRSVAGTCTIRFRSIQDSITVSRAYSHLFKQM
jgi:DNA-binding LytR/AlgR family response regulator